MVQKKQVGVRFPPGLVQKLEGWLEDLNRDRRIALTRTDLICGVLDWAADERPDWERRTVPLGEGHPDEGAAVASVPESPTGPATAGRSGPAGPAGRSGPGRGPAAPSPPGRGPARPAGGPGATGKQGAKRAKP